MIPLSKVEELILKHASLERELSSNTVENKFAQNQKSMLILMRLLR